MKNELNVPSFKNESEEADFWTNLDLTTYFEPSDFKKGVVFPNLKRTKRFISVRLPEQLFTKVQTKAQQLNVPYQQLIQQYIQHGVATK
jgi:predicted DNA binding CopG/RHH family protein